MWWSAKTRAVLLRPNRNWTRFLCWPIGRSRSIAASIAKRHIRASDTNRGGRLWRLSASSCWNLQNQNISLGFWIESSCFKIETKDRWIRTFGCTKKFRKMAKNLLTERLKRAIMYKLAWEQRTLKTIQSKESKNASSQWIEWKCEPEKSGA